MLFRNDSVYSDKLNRAIHNVCKAYNMCSTCGRSYPIKKVTIKHVIEAFNEKMQADFLADNNNNKKSEILHMVD